MKRPDQLLAGVRAAPRCICSSIKRALGDGMCLPRNDRLSTECAQEVKLESRETC
jgi:hypothetical protein